MGNVRVVAPGALIAGITFADEAVFETAVRKLTAEYGIVALKSGIFDFTMTDYYTAEMGENLKKCFYCFEQPVRLVTLAGIKLFTNAVEEEFTRINGDHPSRIVNIDPGYVTMSKLVLASTKDYSHRIYIGNGIYAEVTLRFFRGTFAPFDHTYPDYRTPLAITFFNEVRDFIKRNRYRWMQENE